MRSIFVVMLATVGLAAQAPAPARDMPVLTEFRVFAGTEDITTASRLRVMPTGKRDQVMTLEPGNPISVALPPGIYDVQAFRTRDGSIVAIRWSERFVVMHYPDEGGRHLEVINFEPGFGAIQLRARRGSVSEYQLAIFPSGDRRSPAGAPILEDDYLLYVVPAGRYDIRVRHANARDDDTHWFLDVEVPPDRTRLKLVDVRD